MSRRRRRVRLVASGPLLKANLVKSARGFVAGESSSEDSNILDVGHIVLDAPGNCYNASVRALQGRERLTVLQKQCMGIT
jgi:hypothetical protein